MSHIPYVNRLGDALGAVAAEATASPSLRPRRRRLLRRPPARSRLLAGLAVLAIGGGVATAGTLLSSQSPTVVAARGLGCYLGTPAHPTVSVTGISAGGLTPEQACARVVHRAASKLVACYSPRFGIIVYYRDRSSRECAQAGMRGLSAGYLRAAKRVAVLVRALNRLQATRNCFTPAALASITDAVLTRLHFRGWRAAIQQPPAQAPRWHCAQYPSGDGRYTDAAAAVSTDDNSGPGTVAIVMGASREQELEEHSLDHLGLLARTGARCYSVAAVTRLVRSAVTETFGPDSVVRFVARREPPNTTMGSNRQPRYDAGCATLAGVQLMPDAGLDSLIWQKGWPAMGPGDSVPNRAYKLTLPPKP
jgi:hypothetical protein